MIQTLDTDVVVLAVAVAQTQKMSFCWLLELESTCIEIDKARRKLFAKRHNVQTIPPTKAAL